MDDSDFDLNRPEIFRSLGPWRRKTTPADRRSGGLRSIEIEARPIHKLGRKAVDSDVVFIDDLLVPDEDRIGDEGKGLDYASTV